ncbi:MAG: efflux RND transporter periplasmic adaptor subunit [Pyrinomonadaceae bacterium]
MDDSGKLKNTQAFVCPPQIRAGVSRLCLLLLLAATLFAYGCGRSESNSQARERKDKTGTAAGSVEMPPPPIAVSVETAATRSVPAFVEATGSLAANETSDVATQTSGQVIATPVNVGAFVRQGEVIARLNDRDARLRLQQAQAGVQQAQAGVRQAEARLGLRNNQRFEASTIPEVRAAASALESAQATVRLADANARRYGELVESGDVARSVYDQYRTQAETARAAANSARQQLESAINTARQSNSAIQTAQAGVAAAQTQVAIAQKAVADTVIRAPYSGYVSNRPVAVGEYVTPASVIATVLLTNPIKLQLQVPEADAPRLHPGMSISLNVEAYPNRNFGGRITAINPAIDPASRAITVEAAVDNGGNQLRSGMFATARILQQSGGQAVFVPKEAVLSDANTNSFRVFVVQGDTAHLRVVQIGDEENNMIRIVTGVNGDELVATSNLPQLYEGAKVRAEQK